MKQLKHFSSGCVIQALEAKKTKKKEEKSTASDMKLCLYIHPSKPYLMSQDGLRTRLKISYKGRVYSFMSFKASVYDINQPLAMPGKMFR